eukprot:TRINITY_DN780_c0_g1_i1.p2 TRINITY_DN780_c0_g1~~TRINITY_DN780_c0_g1_i1.p2  ORF type:complete len:130 (+),score=37.92 TRINITY_DN780_c0_g1_i1:92-481(+)
MAYMGDTGMSSPNRKPTGMKGKVHDLAHTLQTQNEDLSAEQKNLNKMKQENVTAGMGMEGQLSTIREYFASDVARITEEFRVQVRLQEAENVRLQQQVTQLKGEKTSIHQQVIALGRRIDELEEEIGNE